MKKLFTILLVICTVYSFAQQPQFMKVGPVTNSQSYWEAWSAYVHLPASYNSSPAKLYPVIFFFPGLSEVGRDTSKILLNGPGAYRKAGWDGSVTVDGKKTEFIIVSFQMADDYPVEFIMESRIATIKKTYRVDPAAVFLTGLSHGGWCALTFISGDPGGGPFTYATQVKAVVTAAAMAASDNTPYPYSFDAFANAGGRLLAYEQTKDIRDVKTITTRMNVVKTGAAVYVPTSYGAANHCCWNQFYGGQGVKPVKQTIDGISQDMYEWMARQITVTAPPVINKPPSVSAGSPVSVIVSTPVKLQGTATDDGNIVLYKWEQVSGGAMNFSSSSTLATTASFMTAGQNVLKLTVTDDKGLSASSTVSVTVTPAIVVKEICGVITFYTDGTYIQTIPLKQ